MAKSKVNRRIIKFSLIITILLFLACWDVRFNDSLRVINNSAERISILHSNQKTGDLTANHIAFFVDDYNTVAPGDTSLIHIMGNDGAWHDYISQGIDQKLYLYVFNVDTLKKYQDTYSMDDLVEMGKYISLLQYSERELKSKHWLIKFK